MKTQDILSYLAGRDGKVTTFKHMTDRFKVKSDEMKAALVDAAATTEGFVILSDLATTKSKDQFEFVLPEIFTFTQLNQHIFRLTFHRGDLLG